LRRLGPGTGDPAAKAGRSKEHGQPVRQKVRRRRPEKKYQHEDTEIGSISRPVSAEKKNPRKASRITFNPLDLLYTSLLASFASFISLARSSSPWTGPEAPLSGLNSTATIFDRQTTLLTRCTQVTNQIPNKVSTELFPLFHAPTPTSPVCRPLT
jgi:hypothetical protein